MSYNSHDGLAEMGYKKRRRPNLYHIFLKLCRDNLLNSP